MEVIFKLIARIAFVIDSLVYGLLNLLYDTFMTMTHYHFLSRSATNAFIGRIWVFIGVIILFRLSISLINYIISPDDFGNEKTGFGNLVTRVIVSLVLLAFTSFGFQQLAYYQRVLLDNNVLAKVILGSSNAEAFDQIENDAGGDALVYSAFAASFTDAHEHEAAIINLKFGDLIDHVTSDNYTPFLDVIIGAFLDYILIGFVIDVAVRMLKLMLYQVLAPIPILGYIDPKKGTDGLTKWLKAVFTTWLDLFLRVGIIYFIIYIVSLLTHGNDIFCEYTANGGLSDTCGQFGDHAVFMKAIIICGLFYFGKQLPGLLQDITGINLGGGGGGGKGGKGGGMFSLGGKLGAVPIIGGAYAAATDGLNKLEKKAIGGAGKLAAAPFKMGANAVGSSVSEGMTEIANSLQRRRLQNGLSSKYDPRQFGWTHPFLRNKFRKAEDLTINNSRYNEAKNRRGDVQYTYLDHQGNAHTLYGSSGVKGHDTDVANFKKRQDLIYQMAAQYNGIDANGNLKNGVMVNGVVRNFSDEFTDVKNQSDAYQAATKNDYENNKRYVAQMDNQADAVTKRAIDKASDRQKGLNANVNANYK